MKNILPVLLVICICSVGAVSQDFSERSPRQPDSKPKNSRLPDIPAEPAEEFTIGPEDVLSITVWREPELSNNRVTVRPDGKIGIPLLNDVQASGLTPKKLQEQVTERLKAFVTGPQVSVIVQEIHSQVVFVTGAVARPGTYTLGGPMTVMELVIRAGGFAEFAKTEDVQILRKESGKPRRFQFNYKQFTEGKNYQQDIPLRNGDLVIVP